MSIVPRTRSRRVLAAALLLTLSLSSLGVGTAFAQGSGASGAPDDSATSPSIDVGEPNPSADGATPAVPDPTVVDLHPQPWDHITVAPDGRTLTIYYWSGVPACYGLGRVEVVTGDAGLTITLFTGTVPGSAMCIEMAQLYSTVVVLDGPLILGGAS